MTDEAWFDVTVEDLDGPGEDYTGRFVVGLFGEVAPICVMNFLAITKGHSRGDELLHYKDSPIHRIVPDFVLQMGDITTRDGTGGASMFGERFNDEDFILSHRSPGWVSMANHGKDTNNSQFFITLVKARWLDGKHVVFGKVVRGFDVVATLGELPADPDTAVPHHKITITDCGVTKLAKPYDIPENLLDSTDDV